MGFCAALTAGAAQAACAPDRLEIIGKSASAAFTVEVADTPQTQQIGLMNRAHMASASGMLFVFESPKNAQFWMKNTLIPLDMLFAGPDGVIGRIHENAIPQDLTVIEGGTGVQFVLEINGGLARRMGIAVGDQMQHPAILGSPCAQP